MYSSHPHNLVSILYALKSSLESHLLQVEEGRFEKKGRALNHAEAILKRAYFQAHRALALTKRMGSFLPPRPRMQESPYRSSVGRAWQKTLEELRKAFSFKGIEILRRIPHDFPLVRCKPADLEEILYHLAQNALQAMKGRGRLVIRASLAFSALEDAHAVIALSDTGPGIPRETLPHLFQPFFTTKPEGAGNGLGLYLVRSLTLKNQGKIFVSSFKRFGTTFTLEFPAVLG